MTRLVPTAVLAVFFTMATVLSASAQSIDETINGIFASRYDGMSWTTPELISSSEIDDAELFPPLLGILAREKNANTVLAV